MTDWYQTSTDSDLGGGFANKIADDVAPADGSQSLPVPALTTRNVYFITDAAQPDNADWEDGDLVMNLEILTGNMNLKASFNAHRVDAMGSILESQTETAQFNAVAPGGAATIVGATWTAGSVGDRLVFELIVENISTMTQYTAEFGVGDSLSLLESQISQSPSAEVDEAPGMMMGVG